MPGLDYCCGDAHFFMGNLEQGRHQAVNLIDKLASYHPQKVILWCPTCLCRLNGFDGKALPFEIISFPQFLAEYMDLLPWQQELREDITLHEACKAANTGLDLTGPRQVLNKIPGARVLEIPRHAETSACCGSGLLTFFPDVFEQVRDERLEEAS